MFFLKVWWCKWFRQNQYLDIVGSKKNVCLECGRAWETPSHIVK